MENITRDPERRAALRLLDEQARRDPDEFRRAYRALIMRAVGFVAFCLLVPLLVLLAGIAGLVWVPGHRVVDVILIVLGAIGTASLLQCVIFRMPAGRGIQLDRRTHALLFKDLNEIRQSIAAPKFDEIEFAVDTNASVYQAPRWLGFLGSHNVLTIGFPLIFALTRQEFRTVLAHEMAHVSRKHGLGHILLIRLFIAIEGIHRQLARKSGFLARLVMGPHLNRLMPALSNHHRVLGRLHELEADKIAAGVCGVPLCATTLVKVAVLCVIAEEDYVGSLDDAMRTSDIPTFKRMEHYLKLVDRARRDPPRLRERIEIELTRHTDLDDSHPALSERLAAIGGSFSGMIDLQSGAAEEYFGRDRTDLITGLDRGWLKSILPHWRQSHNYLRTIKGKLESKQHLLEREGRLYSFEHGQIARWTEEAYGKKAALAAYADYHARYPYLSEGRFHHGRLLLANGDDKGVAVLEEMLGTEPLYREAGFRALADYHLRRRRKEEMHRCLERLEQSYGETRDAIKNRLELNRQSVFTPHGLEQPMIESLYKLCAEITGVRTLHLLRKEVAHFPESPMFVAAIGFGRFKGLPAARERTLEILRAIIDLPGAYLVVDERRSPVVRAGIKKCGRAATKIYDRDDG